MSVKCAKNSLYEYLDHLIDAFLFYKVPIHSRSEKARLINPAKIYTISSVNARFTQSIRPSRLEMKMALAAESIATPCSRRVRSTLRRMVMSL